MAKYIPKDAVLAEIERLKENANKRGAIGKVSTIVLCNELLSFLDSLEVKEVDLEEEMDKEWNKCEPIDEGMGLEIASIVNEQFDNIAKHFFELGLNTSNPLTWEDIKLIWNITDETDNMPEEEFYKEVLKQFKERKEK